VIDGSDLDREPDAGRIALEVTTDGWPPGVHHFQLEMIGISGAVADYRSFTIKIPGPSDQLDVAVEESYYFATGTHFGRFLKLGDGTLLCADKFSPDGGRTWQAGTGGFGAGGQQLADGSILGLEYRCVPEEGNKGWYLCERSLSTDGGRSFGKGQARMFVPEAKPAMGHAFHLGPLFMRSIVQRDNGSLIALMAGWFKSDTALCPYGPTFASRTTAGSRGSICARSATPQSAVRATTKDRCDHSQMESYWRSCGPETNGISTARTTRSCTALAVTRAVPGRRPSELEWRALIPAWLCSRAAWWS
jgi:hypothetical protein